MKDLLENFACDLMDDLKEIDIAVRIETVKPGLRVRLLIKEPRPSLVEYCVVFSRETNDQTTTTVELGAHDRRSKKLVRGELHWDFLPKTLALGADARKKIKIGFLFTVAYTFGFNRGLEMDSAESIF